MQKDLSALVEQTATNALNSIVLNDLGFSSSGQHRHPQNWSAKLGDVFGKALARGIMNTFKEAVKSNKY